MCKNNKYESKDGRNFFIIYMKRKEHKPMDENSGELWSQQIVESFSGKGESQSQGIDKADICSSLESLVLLLRPLTLSISQFCSSLNWWPHLPNVSIYHLPLKACLFSPLFPGDSIALYILSLFNIIHFSQKKNKIIKQDEN